MVRWKTRVIDVDLQASCDTIRHHVLLATVVTRLDDAAVLQRFKSIVKASGSKGVPQGGVRSPLLSHLSLTEVDRMLERAQEVTRSGRYTASEEARCADDMVMVVEAHRRHEWLRQAVAHRLREAWAVLYVTIKEEKSRRVDLARGATFSFLGCDCRRVKSRRGAWRPWYTPRRKKRTALLGKWKEICRRDASQPVERVGDLITPMLRGWVRSCAVGDSHRCFGCSKDWVDKQVRRHLRRARNRKGGGWKRWRRRWRYDPWRLFHNYRVSRPQPKALPVREVP
jgi:RNA-directed DNA polymerase